jgi:ATP-dependent Clp protease adaptor protein ClpS
MSTDIQIKNTVLTKLQPPKLWKVVFLNDDQTPMRLVIELLTTIFKHSEEAAAEITLEIHNTGSGVAGVYRYEIAEQKTVESTTIARSLGSPLKIHIEQE